MAHILEPSESDRCYDCGEPATIVIVADYPDPETGHTDEIALCDEHKDDFLNRMEGV